MPNSKVDMFPSLEVRWFFAGEPEDVTAWFERALPDAERESTREDIYLTFPHAPFAGVKLREYPPAEAGAPRRLNLEFKLRESEPANCQLHEHVRGMVEGWRKWSSTIQGSANDYLDQVGGRGWQTVAKTRRMARFSVAGGLVERIHNAQRVGGGCGVELTHIVTKHDGIEGPAWTSVCFEAFGSANADLMAVLRATVEGVVRVTPPASLSSVADSYSYPEWLGRVVVGKR